MTLGLQEKKIENENVLFEKPVFKMEDKNDHNEQISETWKLAYLKKNRYTYWRLLKRKLLEDYLSIRK